MTSIRQTIRSRCVMSTLQTNCLVSILAGVIWGCGGSLSEPPPPPPGTIPAGEAIGSAAIGGRVTFRGTPPERKPVNMTGEPSCARPGHGNLSEEVIVNADGTLRNVFVRVVSGLGDRIFAPPAEPAEMNQVGCVFVPHLLAVQSNQVIEFRSSDEILHNVRAEAKSNRTFNVSMPGRGRTVRRFFSIPEMVTIRCDLHLWMQATIAVSGHPFFDVTGEDGRFDLAGLPAGTYEVEAWHEKYGTARETITLGEGEQGELEFTFGE